MRLLYYFLIFLIGAVPLWLGWIPPNSLYGIRLGEASMEPEIWYPVNRRVGRMMFIATSVSVIVLLAVAVASRGTSQTPLTLSEPLGMGAILLITLGIVVFSFVALKQEQRAQKARNLRELGADGRHE